MKAAAEVLGQHGLEGATIPRIAQHAGLTPGAVYRRFADKDALVLEVIRRQLDQIIAGQETELRQLRTWEGLQRWRDHLVAGTRAAGGVGGCPLGSLASELADRSEPARKALATCFAEWEAYLVDGFTAMREDSLISREADPAMKV